MRYSWQYARLNGVLVSSKMSSICLKNKLLTLSPGMRVVPLKKQPASSLMLWIVAEATVQEETRAAERKSLLKRI